MPPEPEVVRTPRTGIPIQHRVAVVINDPPPPPNCGVDTATPRAMAEPRLKRWAQQTLGERATIAINNGPATHVSVYTLMKLLATSPW